MWKDRLVSPLEYYIMATHRKKKILDTSSWQPKIGSRLSVSTNHCKPSPMTTTMCNVKVGGSGVEIYLHKATVVKR